MFLLLSTICRKSVKAMLEVKLIYKKEHDIIADASNNLKDLGNELDVVLNALDYLSGAWNISRYPFFNGNNITTPEEFVTEEMCRQGINYSDEVINIAENYLRKHGVI